MPHSSEPERWVIATGNPGKLGEFRRLLQPYAVRPVAMTELGISAAAETGQSFVENALLKARQAARESGLPALADDSGLCVDSLDGAPGLHSARYAGNDANDERNNDLLLKQLAGMPTLRRQAHFVCIIVALRSPVDPDPLIASGRWYGRITAAPRGTNGFGYDPVFEIPELGQTAAQLDPDTKNALSHRGAALRELVLAWSGPGGARVDELRQM